MRPGGLFWPYAVLAVVGAVLPYSAFLPWVAVHGLDARLFWSQLFANPISSFFGWDVIVATVVLIVFVRVQGARDKVPLASLAILAGLTIGVSCGLPLFLALRERALAGRA